MIELIAGILVAYYTRRFQNYPDTLTSYPAQPRASKHCTARVRERVYHLYLYPTLPHNHNTVHVLETCK